MSKSWRINLSKIIWLIVFAIAMGLLEAVVVVYLRALYYPDGFTVTGLDSLKTIPMNMIVIELCREVATIIMLSGIAFLTCRTGDWWGRFAVFIMGFGIWDIFYYIWLKVFINWPESLYTEDVLFLIPFPWLGPVLGPVIVSCVMIAAGLSILIYYTEDPHLKKIHIIYGFIAVWLIFSAFSFSNFSRDANLWNYLLVGLFLGMFTLITIFRKTG